MAKQQRKSPRPDVDSGSHKRSFDSIHLGGLTVNYDWELDYVPLEFKSEAEAEKVRRRISNKDRSCSLPEAAKGRRTPIVRRVKS